MPSQKVLDYLNQRSRKSDIPELPMDKIRLNGNTGDFLITVPDPDNDGKSKQEIMANPDGTPIKDSFGGVILKVMFYAEKKTKWSEENGKRVCTSKVRRITREFDNFREEPISVLDISEGYPGKPWKTFANYPEFKNATTLKAEGDNEGTWDYTLKAVLYILRLSTHTLMRMPVSGNGLSEIFAYESKKKAKSSKAISEPWQVKFSDAKDISQIKTVIRKNEHVNETSKATSYFVSFSPIGICSDDEMEIVVDKAMELQEWQDAWKAMRKEQSIEKVEMTDVPTIQIEEQLADVGLVDPVSSNEIRMEDIPF